MTANSSVYAAAACVSSQLNTADTWARLLDFSANTSYYHNLIANINAAGKDQSWTSGEVTEEQQRKGGIAQELWSTIDA